MINKKHFLSLMIIIFPFIDLATAFFVRANYLVSFGMAMRGLFLILLLFYFLRMENVNSKLKKNIINYFTILVVFFVCFLVVRNGVGDAKLLFLETKNFIKIFYFPVVILLIYALKKELQFDKKMLIYMLAIYSTLLITPLLLNIANNSYGHFKSGFIGLFYSPNEIGAILGIIFPYAIYSAILNKRRILSYILISILIFTMLTIGTKVPLVAIVFTIIIFFAFLIKKLLFPIFFEKEASKLLGRIVIISIIAFIMISNSSSLTNFVSHKSRLDQDETKTEVEQAVNLVFSSRDVYFENNLEKFMNAGFPKIVFGIGSVDQEYVGRTVEIDYFDIMFNYGLIGSLLYFLPLVLFFKKIFIVIIKKLDYYLSSELILVHLTAIGLALGIALFAGRTFTAPSVSFFLAFIIVALINDLDNMKVGRDFNNKKKELEKKNENKIN